MVHKRVFKLDFKLQSLGTSILGHGVPTNAMLCESWQVTRLHLGLAVMIHKRVFKLDLKLQGLDTFTLGYGVPTNAMLCEVVRLHLELTVLV